jgi:hypothetical protein
MIRVFHAVQTRYLDEIEDVDFPANYVHVADVKTDDLEKAFELTNTIDHLWWQNKNVKPDWAGAREWALRDADVVEKQYKQPSTAAAIRQRAGEGFRSTSVGDVLQKGNVYYAVARFGFDPLPFGTSYRRGASLGAVTPRGRTDIHGSPILTYEGTLPAKLARAMDAGAGRDSEEYIKYHEKAARKALKDLQRKLGFEVHKTWMAPSGWFDGMYHLHAIVRTRKGNRLTEIAWLDSHGGGQWMEVGHGQSLMSESALEGFGAAKRVR